MNLMIGAVVIVIIIAVAVFFMAGKSKSDEISQTGTESKGTELSGQTGELTEKKTRKQVEGKCVNKENKIIDVKEKVKETIQEEIGKQGNSKEQLYKYMNHELQNLFFTYNKEEWDSLTQLSEISSSLYKEKNEIIEGLSSVTGRMVREYFSCVDFIEEEGKLIGYVKDKNKLKEVFLEFMMPFYPYYYKELSEGGLRHTALLHPNTLRLFQQLTGKKFRPGYRNRYTTGVRAFEWDKDRYKVYEKNGKLLCDAIFGTDGIIEGYGQKKYSDKEHPDWNIVEEGNWKAGVFQGGILRYEYKKSVK